MKLIDNCHSCFYHGEMFCTVIRRIRDTGTRIVVYDLGEKEYNYCKECYLEIEKAASW